MSKGYAHGGNIEEVARDFGIKEDCIIDFSANVNPFPLPQNIYRIIRSGIPKICRYPDRESLMFKKALGRRSGISAEHIVAGNGSIDLIYRAVDVLRPKTGFIIKPVFGEYEKALAGVGAKIRYLLLREKNNFNCSIDEIIRQADGAEVIFLCNPNNPTGSLIPKKDLLILARRLRRTKTILILDEAFIDLEREHSLIDVAVKSNNLLVIRSMTKFFGLAGLRLGYAVGNRGLIKRIECYGHPWPVNVFAQAVGEELIQDRQFIDETKRRFIAERGFLFQQICRIKGVRPFPSHANFILIKIENRLSSRQLQRRLLKRGLFIRDCSNFSGLNDKYIRIAVRRRKDNLRLIRELREIFNGKDSGAGAL